MHFKNLSQKIAKISALTVAGIIAGIMFTPTDTFGALPKKKLEIIIGGENFCKDDKDCAGDSFCNMTSHICITCPKPFEWVGGTQCICPSGTVPNADNTDCVECMSDENCQDLKGNLYWVCDTDTNTCECMSGLHEKSGECVCDNENKELDTDGFCRSCTLTKEKCPNSDFTGPNDCKCCPAETPKWNGLECRTCADVDKTKPYYNSDTKMCVECLTDGQCTDGVCIDNVCYPCREDSDCAGNKVCQDKQCVCEMTSTDCPTSDFTNAEQCACCPVDKPKWDASTSTCKTCADVDASKPYHNLATKTCEECLTDAHCPDGVCIDNVCYPCREDSDCAGNKVCQDKQCVCEMTSTDCPTSDFTNAEQCACCPADKPKWDGTDNACLECLTNEDCNGSAVCSADKTCICEITSTDCPASDFVAEQCMCCPSDKPKWNETTKMCEICPTDKPYYSATQQTCIIPTCTDFGLKQGLLATYVRGQDCNTAWRDGFGPFYQLWGAYDWMYIYGSAGNYCKDNAITLIGQLYAPVEGIYTYQLWARPDDDEKNIDQVDVHVDGILQYTVWGVDENNQGRLANTVSLNLKPGLHSFAYWGDQNERGGITLLPVSVPAHTMFCH